MPITRPTNEDILNFTAGLADKLSAEDFDKLSGYVSYLVVSVSLLEDESEVIDLILEADDHEYPIIETVAERAGLMWRCQNPSIYFEGEICGAINYYRMDKCPECDGPQEV